MKKVQTEYVKNIGHWDSWDTITIIVNEEVKDHIQLKIYQDRWKTRQEHIDFLTSIIQELENFDW